MKRWLLILAGGIGGAILLGRRESNPGTSSGRSLSSNALARVRVSGGGSHALAIAPDGSLWSWGDAGSALGLGRPVPGPSRVGAENDWWEIVAGFSHSLALKRDGSLWAWGANPAGMLGDGTDKMPNAPIRIGRDTNWLQIGTGLHHSAGLKRDSSIWAWGGNNFGQLGNPSLTNTTNQSWIPIRVGTETNWKALAVCSLHNVALKRDGTLWTWGDSSLGPAVSANSPSNHYTPTQIGTDTNWLALAAGYYHTLALKSDGTLWHWGRNAHLLGGVQSKDRTVPQPLGSRTNWVAIYDGGYHNLARRADGSLWQLGNGNFRDKPDTNAVAGAWIAAAGGAEFSVAVTPDGSLWTWGKILGVKKNRTWLQDLVFEAKKKLGLQKIRFQPRHRAQGRRKYLSCHRPARTMCLAERGHDGSRGL